MLTTASSGSANGLQAISDRLADSFSILPGHHGTGENNRRDGDGVGGRDGDDDEAEDGESGGVKSFAMFACERGTRSVRAS